MSNWTEVDLAKAGALLDVLVERGFGSIQRRVSASHGAGAGTMISNSPERSPLVTAGGIERVAEVLGTSVGVELLELVNASVLRVRPNSSYVTSMAPDPKQAGHYVVLLNNKWFK